MKIPLESDCLSSFGLGVNQVADFPSYSECELGYNPDCKSIPFQCVSSVAHLCSDALCCLSAEWSPTVPLEVTRAQTLSIIQLHKNKPLRRRKKYWRLWGAPISQSPHELTSLTICICQGRLACTPGSYNAGRLISKASESSYLWQAQSTCS